MLTNGRVVVVPDADSVILLYKSLLSIVVISTPARQKLFLDQVDVGHAGATKTLQGLVPTTARVWVVAIVIVPEDDPPSVLMASPP